MLRWRLISSAIIISLALGLVWCDFHRVANAPEGTWLAPLYLLAMLLGTRELLELFAAGGYRPVAWPIYLGVLATSGFACTPIVTTLLARAQLPPLAELMYLFHRYHELQLLSLAGAAILLFFTEIYRYEANGKHLTQVALGLFALFYMGLLGSYFPALRFFVPAAFSQMDPQLGLIALLSTIVIVKAADAGAYATGKLWGRTKIAPKLSPGKTLEGTVGGFAAAAVASLLFFRFLAPHLGKVDTLEPGIYVTYGLLLAAAGMIGDLIESLLKREMGRKDSSSWLAGLGGVLDILDSLLTAAPVAYACWLGKIIS